MLEQEYKTLYNCASIIPNWKTANKNDLANAYVDNENNERLKDAYFSALMLRYWGNIGKYYISSKDSGFSIQDCYSWLVEALTYSLKQRKWRDPSSSMYEDKNGPDKIINRCIFSRRQYYYYLSNTANRKANVHALSLDDEENIEQDHNAYLTDYSYLNNKLSLDISTISYSLYRQNNWLESFLLSYLLLNDFSTYVKTKDEWKLDKTSLIASIKKLSYDDFKYFVNSISENISEDRIKENYRELKEIKENKVRYVIDKALNNLRENKDLQSLLCY